MNVYAYIGIVAVIIFVGTVAGLAHKHNVVDAYIEEHNCKKTNLKYIIRGKFRTVYDCENGLKENQ